MNEYSLAKVQSYINDQQKSGIILNSDEDISVSSDRLKQWFFQYERKNPDKVTVKLDN